MGSGSTSFVPRRHLYSAKTDIEHLTCFTSKMASLETLAENSTNAQKKRRCSNDDDDDDSYDDDSYDDDDDERVKPARAQTAVSSATPKEKLDPEGVSSAGILQQCGNNGSPPTPLAESPKSGVGMLETKEPFSTMASGFTVCGLKEIAEAARRGSSESAAKEAAAAATGGVEAGAGAGAGGESRRVACRSSFEKLGSLTGQV